MTGQNQDTALPFMEIPEYPDNYTAEHVAARMIEGLGVRYYWATEGLRTEDLNFKPSEEARTSLETLDHILGLSRTILLPLKKEPLIRSERPELTFEEMRRKTLENLKEASDLLRSGNALLSECKIEFKSGERSSEFPYWHNLNGPIADALWHTGQIVSFRRSSGNPFPGDKISLFSGKLRQ